jgi:hypothetical protein
MSNSVMRRLRMICTAEDAALELRAAFGGKAEELCAQLMATRDERDRRKLWSDVRRALRWTPLPPQQP